MKPFSPPLSCTVLHVLALLSLVAGIGLFFQSRPESALVALASALSLFASAQLLHQVARTAYFAEIAATHLAQLAAPPAPPPASGESLQAASSAALDSLRALRSR